MEHFAPYSTTHLLTVVVCIGLGLWIWRMAANAEVEPMVRRAWVRAVLIVQSINVLYFALRQPFDWASALPLQVCDVMGWVAAWSLSTDRRLPRTMLVFAGLLLCGQAFVTPTLAEGPATLRFWLFFASHFQIVASAFYELLVRGYAPTMRDAANAWCVLLAYAALMVPLNLVTGWNYGYVGPTNPGAFTAIEILGPWPLRLVTMGVVVAAGSTLLVLSVRAVGTMMRRRRRSHPSTLRP